jgi:hypothetical protein
MMMLMRVRERGGGGAVAAGQSDDNNRRENKQLALLGGAASQDCIDCTRLVQSDRRPRSPHIRSASISLLVIVWCGTGSLWRPRKYV